MAFRQTLRDEKGAVAVTVALLLIVFLGFTALVVDYGYLTYVQRKLQTAADAAALAGAQEVIYQGDQAAANMEAICNKVIEYALENGVPESELQDIDINTSEGYVRVIVGRNVGLFFAKALGISSNERIARARAQTVWVTGLKGLVPFGVIDVRPDEVWAGFNGGLVKLSDPDNDSIYTGSVKAPLSAGSHDVIVRTVDYDTPANGLEIIASAVMVEPSKVKRVTLGPSLASPSGSVSVSVAVNATATPDSVSLSVGGINRTLSHSGMDSSGNLSYSGTFTAPSSSGTYPAYIEVTQDGIAEVAGPVGYLRVIDSYSVIGEVKVSPSTAPGDSSIYISVEIKGFEYGTLYDLKLGSDPYTGNFMSVALDESWGGNDYGENIVNGSTTDYNIGDIIWTEPGNKQGPTKHGLNTRIGSDECDWGSWSNLETRHLGCPRLVTVPLVASTGYKDGNGRHKMVITGFATFFIESWGDDKGNIKGFFVEYPEVGKGWTSEDPGDPLRPKTVRLVPFD
ncbi:MAG: hypothetical protein IBX64_13600 [Actinobacteria bacterium]|nr:hypothetical protein [Actinomycetota bacterium]